MTSLSLALLLLLLPALPAHAQQTEPPAGTRIASAEVSGFDIDRLSPGLKEDIDRLTGTSLDRTRLRDLADRIELERPQYVAAVRASLDASGEARVTFVVARIGDQAPDANVNARYIVEAARFEGSAEAERRVPAELRAEMDALVGKPLDTAAADRLDERLSAALPDYDVQRQSKRGNQRGQIVLIFRLERSEAASWLRTEPIDAHAVYHSDQGWSANLPLSISSRFLSINPIVTVSDTEGHVEEDSGFGVRVESRRLGTERLGAVLEWSTSAQRWRPATRAAVAADPSVPALYRHRTNVTPLVKFAVTPRLTVGGGVSITQLRPFMGAPGSASRMNNAAVGIVRFHEAWNGYSSERRAFDAGVTIHSGLAGLQSDLRYTRFLGDASYLRHWARHQQILLTAMGGGISGHPPLFERFSLGDARTLRGWDQYDLAPAGGTRMYSASAEYLYRDAGLFLDAGSVWSAGQSVSHRFSTGITYAPGPFFVTLGFPLNTREFHATFAMGFKWPLR